MMSIGRREFLEWGAVATLAGSGCVGVKELLLPGEPISVEQMDAYLAQLDRSMAAISTSQSRLSGIVPAGSVAADAVAVAHAENHIRKTMRSLLMVGSFRDLPERARMHPGMQARMWATLPEMDEAVAANHAYLSGLLPAERAELNLALRAHPDLTRRLAVSMDDEALRLGVPLDRRQQMRNILGEVDARLRHQSVDAVVGEYLDKAQRLETRGTSVEMQQRRLIAQLGEEGYWQYRSRLERHANSWSGGIAVGGAGAQPGSNGGSGVLIGAGATLGVAAVLTAVGIAVTLAENAVGWFFLTFGAIGLLTGLILLIAGAVLAARDDPAPQVVKPATDTARE